MTSLYGDKYLCQLYRAITGDIASRFEKERKIMEQEDKDLLLKDLCARLPYTVKINIKDDYLQKMVDDILCAYHIGGISYNLENRNLKPYLRPMSSMTEEERLELSKLTDDKFKFYLYTWNPEIICYEKYNYLEGLKVLDWLNAHYFDYRGLIEKGLALEAKKGMYKTE